jgi:hypothetical protein
MPAGARCPVIRYQRMTFLFPINKRFSVIWKRQTRATSHPPPETFPISPGYRKESMGIFTVLAEVRLEFFELSEVA